MAGAIESAMSHLLSGLRVVELASDRAAYVSGEEVIVETEKGTRIGTVALSSVRRPHRSSNLKRILRLDRLRLRGPKGASDEFLLAATAQNLRRMAKRWLGSPPTAVPIAV